MPARTYDLLQDFVKSGGDRTSISVSPFWILAVVRIDRHLSYSRKGAKSVTNELTEGAQLRDKTLIITGDCRSMQVSGAKENHTKSLTAQLVESEINYLAEILPDDWVLGWIVNSEKRAEDVIGRIKSGEACNKFEDGFKFVGRVEGIRKRLSVTPSSGVKEVHYQLSAFSFRELDCQLFYDHALNQKNIEQLGNVLVNLGISIRDLLKVVKDEEGGAGGLQDNVHKIIPTLIEVFYGKGVSPTISPGSDAGLDAAAGAGAPSGSSRSRADVDVVSGGAAPPPAEKAKPPPFAYLVPEEVGKLLGRKSRDDAAGGGILAYADILDLLVGVQEYTDSSENKYEAFQPRIESSTTTHRYTGSPMPGAFMPAMPDCCGKPIWGVLQGFLNSPINEMYTALRTDGSGNVVPTLVIRQVPFTSPAFTIHNYSSKSAIQVTPFLSLPRWKMADVLVTSLDIGRSMATKANFVHVYGQDALQSSNMSITDQMVQNPPIRDDLDIARTGLRMFSTTTACVANKQIGKLPRIWMEFIADRLMNSHVTLNGTMVVKGLHVPICEGDNLEWDSTVYHIESVSHSAFIDPMGMKHFSTTLTLTNGIRSDTGVYGDDGGGDGFGGNSDTDETATYYQGFMPGDNQTKGPGLTVENIYEREAGEREKRKPYSPDKSTNGKSTNDDK